MFFFLSDTLMHSNAFVFGRIPPWFIYHLKVRNEIIFKLFYVLSIPVRIMDVGWTGKRKISLVNNERVMGYA